MDQASASPFKSPQKTEKELEVRKCLDYVKKAFGPDGNLAIGERYLGMCQISAAGKSFLQKLYRKAGAVLENLKME